MKSLDEIKDIYDICKTTERLDVKEFSAFANKILHHLYDDKTYLLYEELGVVPFNYWEAIIIGNIAPSTYTQSVIFSKVKEIVIRRYFICSKSK